MRLSEKGEVWHSEVWAHGNARTGTDVTFSRTVITKPFLTGPWKVALGEARRGTHSSGLLCGALRSSDWAHGLDWARSIVATPPEPHPA